jgi:hypothetical protein
VYELPFGRGRAFGGWQLSGIAGVHSNVPLTPVLSFDNADQQSLIISECFVQTAREWALQHAGSIRVHSR